MTNKQEKIDYCIEQHRATNHMYDTYLPYEFHLRMVATAAKDFTHVHSVDPLWKETVEIAAYAHDLIEDTRTSYNDVKANLGELVANIVYAVSNEKGKNRKERANEKYYEGIRATPGATFIKLCDRIANVQYSKMTQSKMFDMYRKENENFINSIGYSPDHQLISMFNYLNELFTDSHPVK
jgi:(p)ppGpp synthase/HD superfamily hydrolase